MINILITLALTLKMEAANSPETLVPTYNTRRYYVLDDNTLNVV
jgi:hypothetical protein